MFFTNPGQPNLEDRLKGYQDILEDYKGIKIVDVFDIKADPGTALDQAILYLARTGSEKIDAFVCLEPRSGANVAEAFRRRNVTDRVLIAMDADTDTLQLVGMERLIQPSLKSPTRWPFWG